MPNPLDPRLLDSCVEGVAAAHQRLLEVVDTLNAEQFAAPSSLPGWNRTTLIGHLTMNARSFVHLLACAGRGEVGEQYPGGVDARNAGIEEASSWTPEQATKELRKAVYMLEGAWAGATNAMWNGTGTVVSGSVIAMHEIPFLRWRESVIHLTDLDVEIGYDQWPDMYVRLELERQKMAWAASHPMGLTQIPQAALKLNEKHRLAWLLQRADVEGLPKGPGL